MPKDSENQIRSEKTPQEELEELLRQARSTSGGGLGGNKTFAKGRSLGRAMAGISWSRLKNKRTVVALGLAALAVVLVVGTGIFLVSLFTSNTGLVVLEMSQTDVELVIDGQGRGIVNSGDTLRLKTGEHALLFSKESFLSAEQTVEVTQSETVSVLVSLLPIPVIEPILSGQIAYPRLSHDGTGISFLDKQDNVFKTVDLVDKQTAELFRGNFSEVVDVNWSGANQMALVQLAGVFSLTNMIDNRSVPGGYVVLGDRPGQAPSKNNGIATWLFDNSRQLAASGWQPILLNESVRQTAYAANGANIIYIYDTADDEYSLVRALPDGREWERVIVDLPRFANPQMTWGADDRYLLIEDEDKLWLADLVDRSLADVFVDRTPKSRFAISNEGDKVAYVAGNEVRIYDLVTLETTTVPELSINEHTIFTWIDTHTLVLALVNQTFSKVDIETGLQVIIPFVGTEAELTVTELTYSRVGQVLMMVTADGLYVMKI